MKTILIGSVNSSKTVLEIMIQKKFPVDLIFSLDEKHSSNVSGYVPLHKIAIENKIPYKKFHKINDDENIQLINKIKPDYIFVIGLSQLIKDRILNAATRGVIGFHPTGLPKFRGRAAIVWQILLGVEKSKATLFFIDEGADSGDIIAQEEYIISSTDYALDVSKKCNEALFRMLPGVLDGLINNSIEAKKQDDCEATYLLKRAPEDGLIDWNKSAEKIQRLIRATSKPYPGAFTFYKGNEKIVIWRADYLENIKYFGIPGQIAAITTEYIDVVCGEGLLRIHDYECDESIKLVEGNKFKSNFGSGC